MQWAFFVIMALPVINRIEALRSLLSNNQDLPGFDAVSAMQAEALCNLIQTVPVNVTDFMTIQSALDTMPWATGHKEMN